MVDTWHAVGLEVREAEGDVMKCWHLLLAVAVGGAVASCVYDQPWTACSFGLSAGFVGGFKLASLDTDEAMCGWEFTIRAWERERRDTEEELEGWREEADYRRSLL